MSLNINYICRLCMVEGNPRMISIFDDEIQKKNTVELSTRIMTLAAVKVVAGDRLPTQICRLCAARVDQWYQFKLMCEMSDAALRERLDQSCYWQNLQVKEEPPDEDTEGATTIGRIFSAYSLRDDLEFCQGDDASEIAQALRFNEDTAQHASGNFAIPSDSKMQFTADSNGSSDSRRQPTAEPLQSEVKENLSEPSVVDNDCHYSGVNGRLKLEALEEVKDENYINSHSNAHKLKGASEVADLKGIAADLCNDKRLVVSDIPMKRLLSNSSKKKVEALFNPMNNVLRVCEKNKVSSGHRCPICKRIFSYRKDCVRHIRIHTGERPYTCPMCNQAFAEKGNLDRHVHLHVGVRRFPCQVCNRRFARKSHMEAHMMRHTGQKPFACTLCDKAFGRRDQLRWHIGTHRGEKPHACPDCGVCFAQRNDMRRHQFLHTGLRPYECTVCKRCFSSANNFKRHTRVHTGEGRFECPTCKKSYVSKFQLQHHLRLHNGERPNECSICKRAFVSQAALTRHSSVHLNKCTVCEKSFGNSWHLKNHMRCHVEERVKPLKCSDCDRRFVYKSELEKHAIVHTGQKPFECSSCHKMFRRKVHLAKHVLLHMQQGGSFECSACGKSYVRRGSYIKHLKLH